MIDRLRAKPTTRSLRYLLCSIGVLAAASLPLIVSAQDNEVPSLFYVFLWSIVNGLFGMLVAIGGTILDTGINLFVVYFGQQFSTTGLGFVVNEVWVYIRDIFNLTFIFGLVYIGFKMILDANDSNSKRWLAYLVLAALLVNFSLFITKFVIDFSNILATQLVTNGFAAQASVWPWLNDLVGGETWYSVSNAFAEVMGLPSIWGGDGSIVADRQETPNSFGYIFGSMILFVIAAIVFAAGGLMLIVRFIVLNIYMLLSPFMFIGWVFPQLSGLTSKYWRGFLGQAFFAPAYLLMLYFSFRLLSGYGVNAENRNLADVFTGEGTTALGAVVSALSFFIVVCGFMVGAIIVANKLSEAGANGTMGVVQRTNRRVQAGARRVMMSPVRTGRDMGAYEARRRTAALGTNLERRLRRLQERGGEGASRYDRLVGATARAADRSVGGTAQNMQNARFGLARTQSQVNRDRATVDQRATRGRNIEAGLTAAQALEENRTQNNLSQTQVEAYQKQVNEMQRILATSNAGQVQDLLTRYKSDEGSYNSVVRNMTATQFDSIMKDTGEGSLDEAAKSKLQQARQSAIQDRAREGAQASYVRSQAAAGNTSPQPLSDEEALARGITDTSQADLEQLSADTLAANARGLSSSQLDAIQKSNRFSDDEKFRISQAYASGSRQRMQQKEQVQENTRAQQSGQQPRQIDEDEAVSKQISKLGPAELKHLGVANVSQHAADLSASQLDDVKKNFSEPEVDAIMQARENKLWERFNQDGASKVVKGKPSEIAKLPTRILTDKAAAPHLSPASLEKMKELDDTARSQIRENINQSIATSREQIRNDLDTQAIDQEVAAQKDKAIEEERKRAEKENRAVRDIDDERFNRLRQEMINQKVEDTLKQDPATRSLQAAETWLEKSPRGQEF